MEPHAHSVTEQKEQPQPLRRNIVIEFVPNERGNGMSDHDCDACALKHHDCVFVDTRCVQGTGGHWELAEDQQWQS